MDPVFKEIKNWQLFVDKFGEDYSMHDAVVKRFDLNEDELTVVLNTVYEIGDKSVYDITFKFSDLVNIVMDCEIGDDYVWGVDVEKDAHFKNLFKFRIESTQIVIKCFTIELVSIIESDSFQRGMILFEDENVSSENAKIMWRS